MNLHSNERHEGESWPDYKARRAASKAAVRLMTRGPTQEKYDAKKHGISPDFGAWWLGQHTSLVHNGVRLERRLEKFGKVMQSQRLKAGKVRKHKQYRHPLRDQYGDAYTQVGRDPLKRIGRDGKPIRRVWLAGISAQRGY
mgnify:CR=1 FL=1